MSDLILPRDDLRALEGYHSAQVDVPVRLNTNESPYPPPDAFLARWLDALASVDYHRYPDRAATALRARLGAFLGQPVERIFCANGSNEVLQTLLLTYGGPGRSAALFEPTYALHAHIARITGTDVVTGERQADFGIDVPAAEALIASSHPSVVFVCSPNNPTGTVEGREVIERLAEVAAAAGALLVVDEAYGEFAPWSAVELVDDARPLVVVRTYSKVWSLAAIRLGFAVGPGWVLEELEKVALPYALSVPTQVAGEVALGVPRRDGHARRHARGGAWPAVRGAAGVPRAAPVSVGRQLPARARRRRCARTLGATARARRTRARFLALAAGRRMFAGDRRHARRERRAAGRAPGGLRMRVRA